MTHVAYDDDLGIVHPRQVQTHKRLHTLRRQFKLQTLQGSLFEVIARDDKSYIVAYIAFAGEALQLNGGKINGPSRDSCRSSGLSLIPLRETCACGALV